MNCILINIKFLSRPQHLFNVGGFSNGLYFSFVYCSDADARTSSTIFCTFIFFYTFSILSVIFCSFWQYLYRTFNLNAHIVHNEFKTVLRQREVNREHMQCSLKT